MRLSQLLSAKGPPPAASGRSSYAPEGWATASETISEDNLLWRQYITFIDLYKYYIDLIWKVTIWFYTVIGVSLAYFFTHLNSGNRGYLPLLLLFLGALGIGVSRIFTRIIPGMVQMEEWLEYIAVSLKLPGRPHVAFVRWFCRFISGTLLLTAGACFGFYAYLQA